MHLNKDFKTYEKKRKDSLCAECEDYYELSSLVTWRLAFYFKENKQNTRDYYRENIFINEVFKYHKNYWRRMLKYSVGSV